MQKTIAISALTVLALLSAGSAFAAPAGCQAKGSLYIVDKGNVIQTLNVTPGAGTTAATSNQGHVGFKTDANGNFNVSFPYVPLTGTQTYYFRMEVYNSKYLAYTFAGHPNSFKLTSSPVSGQVVCENPAVPSQKAGIKLTTAPALQLCDVASAGQKCRWGAIYEPNYFAGSPSNSYGPANIASYSNIPRCTAPAPSTAPATTPRAGHTALSCMREFEFIKPAAPITAASYYNQIPPAGNAVEIP